MSEMNEYTPELYELEDENGNKKDFEMNVLKDDEIVNKLINNMISLLEELKHDYPKNIKINN